MTDAQVEALNDKTCIVCREDMIHARRLPCSHAFHSNCLMLWVQNGSNCPTCRKDIIVFLYDLIRDYIDRGLQNQLKVKKMNLLIKITEKMQIINQRKIIEKIQL